MSYNWEKASTPKGRERLKELMDSGHKVVCKASANDFGRNSDEVMLAYRFSQDGQPFYYLVHAWIPANGWENANFDDIEFLDPEPQKPHPITIDEMREYCIKWCEGHEEPLDSENWCSARPQHAERPMAWNICSTFFSANDSADNQIQLVYAIIRAIESGEISQGKEANP